MAVLFQENWNGSSIDTSTWTVVSGSYSVASNSLTGYFDMNTRGKKSFTCSSKTIIEFSTQNLNSSQDINFALDESTNYSNSIGFYCNENFYDQGLRMDFAGSFGSGYTNIGGDLTTRQYYKVTLEGTSVKIQQGSSYGTYDRELVRTANTTTTGKVFNLRISSNNGSTGQGIYFPITVTDTTVIGSSKFFQLF